MSGHRQRCAIPPRVYHVPAVVSSSVVVFSAGVGAALCCLPRSSDEDNEPPSVDAFTFALAAGK
eukprot:21585-Eustigmatos_ZCMA.PRE.1